MYEYLIDFFFTKGNKTGRSLRSFSSPLDSIEKINELERTLTRDTDCEEGQVAIRNFTLINSPVPSTAKLEMENEKLKESLQKLLEIFSGSTMEMLFSEEEYEYISSLKKEFLDI